MSDSDAREKKIEIVTFSTLYPSAVQPNHGVFVENRLRHLVGSGSVRARVVAPVPWFPSKARMFGDYSKFAMTPREETRFDIPVIHPRFPLVPKIGMLISPFLLYRAMLPVFRRLMSERDFHIIDAHYFYPDGVAAAWIGRAIGKPVVITARGTDISLIPQFAIPRRWIVSAAKMASGVIAVSQSLKDAMVALGVAPESIRVLRNGVDAALFNPRDRDLRRQELGITGQTLLSVGHLVPRKGHDLVIEALGSLPQFSLLIAGDGPERAALQSLAQRLGLGERVRFLGAVPHAELQKIYVAADALILASSREGWPNVLLEAMACGTPVVASNIWGNPEVVQRPEAGEMMTARSAQGVADAVLRLFRRLPDRAATRLYAEGFSWHDTTEGQLQLFRGILKGEAAQVYGVAN